MKTFKYVTMLLAFIALSTTFTSCSKDVNPDVDAKQNYWIEISLSNPGSLSADAQQLFNKLIEEVVYNGGNHYSMYCTEGYAKTNFQAVIASMTPESDFVKKVVIPTAKVDMVKNFEFSLILSKEVDEGSKTLLDSHVFKASEILANVNLSGDDEE